MRLHSNEDVVIKSAWKLYCFVDVFVCVCGLSLKFKLNNTIERSVSKCLLSRIHSEQWFSVNDYRIRSNSNCSTHILTHCVNNYGQTKRKTTAYDRFDEIARIISRFGCAETSADKFNNQTFVSLNVRSSFDAFVLTIKHRLIQQKFRCFLARTFILFTNHNNWLESQIIDIDRYLSWLCHDVVWFGFECDFISLSLSVIHARFCPLSFCINSCWSLLLFLASNNV